MSDPCAPEWADLIEQCLGGDGSPDDWARLQAHLAAHPECKAWYDEQARLTALLAGEPDGLAPAAAAAGEARLLAALGATAAEPAAPEPAKVLQFPARRMIVGAGLLLAAAAAAVVWVNRPVDPTPIAREPAGFQARGAGEGEAQHGFRAFCIDVSGAEPTIRATAVADGPPVRCRVGDRLQVMWSAATPAPVYLGLLSAQDAELKTLRAPTAPALTEPGIIKRTWRLEQPGQVALHGVFAPAPVDRPLTAAELRGENPPGPVHTAQIVVEAAE